MGTARYHAVGPLYSPPFSVLSRGTASLAVAVAAFCAASVFFILCERDHSTLTHSVAPTVLADTTEVTRVDVIPAAGAAAGPVLEETAFHVKRSRRFQRVGAIAVGLWRVDAKRGSYSVSLLAGGLRINRKHIGVDEAISIPLNQGAEKIRFVARHLDKDEISGVIVTER